jgi:hypothetical protein
MRDKNANRRRQLRRVMKPLPAAFTAGDRKGQGYISKLSRKGLFFATDDLPTPGDAVRIAFQNNEGKTLKVNGIVRWNTTQLGRRASGFGIEIDAVPDAYLAFYDEILTS